MIQARVLHGFRHTTASTRFNVNLYAQSKSPIHVNAISNCFEPLQGLVNTWWGWTVSNFRVSVLLRKLLVGAKYHKNSKSNATTLAFILIEFPFIHPSKQKIIYNITLREYINVQSCISQSFSNSKSRLCSQTKFLKSWKTVKEAEWLATFPSDLPKNFTYDCTYIIGHILLFGYEKSKYWSFKIGTFFLYHYTELFISRNMV